MRGVFSFLSHSRPLGLGSCPHLFSLTDRRCGASKLVRRDVGTTGRYALLDESEIIIHPEVELVFLAMGIYGAL